MKLEQRLLEALHTVYCSQCGGEFKSEKATGFSHCKDHQKMLKDREEGREGLKEQSPRSRYLSRSVGTQVGALIIFNEGVDIDRVRRWVESLGEHVESSTVKGFDSESTRPTWYCP